MAVCAGTLFALKLAKISRFTTGHSRFWPVNAAVFS